MTAYQYRVSQQLTFKPRERTYGESHPVNFYTFYGDIKNPGSNEAIKTKNTLYYDGSYTPRPLILRVYNQISSSISTDKTLLTSAGNNGNSDTPAADHCHFCLRFLNGVLAASAIDNQGKTVELKDDQGQKWFVQIHFSQSDRYVDIYFLKKTEATLSPQSTDQGSQGISIDLSPLSLYIDINHPEDNSLVALIYGPLMHDASNTKLKSSDDTYYSIKQKIVFQHRIGQQQIPLHVGFVGSNTILNDGIDLPNLCLSEKVDQIANQNLSFRLVCKKHPEKVLGLKNDLTSDNTSLELQDKRDSNDAQRWILKPGRLDGSYTIASKKDNNHVIDLPGKDTNPDKELKIFPKHTKKGGHYDDKNQDWQLKSAGDGYFYIVSGCVTSKQQQLTISVGSDGSRIQTVLLKNKAEQLWKLEVDEKKIKLRRNNLRLRIVNTLKESELIPERSQIDFDKDSRFIISFDTDPNLDSTNGHKKEEWMLGNQGQIDAITISLLDHSKDTWKFDDHDNRTIKPKGDQTIFRANKGIEIELSNIVTDYPTGTANMYIRYENIPGYWDGQFIVPIEKTPLVYRKDSIAMGTTSPEAYLHIKANDKTNDTFNRRNLAIFEANDLGNSNPVIIRGFQGETNALWIADNSTNIPTVAIDNLGKGSALDVAGSVSIFDDRSILDPSIFIDDQNGKKSGRNSLWVKSFANNKVDTSADKEYPTVWLENTGSASTLHVENSGTGDDKGLALEINGDTVFQKGSKIIGIPTLEFREFRTQAGKIDLKSDDVSAYKYRDIEYHQSFSGEIIQYCLMLTDWHIWCVDKEGKKVSNDFSLSEIKIGVYHHQINEKNKCQVDFNFRIGVGTTRDFKCDYAISLIALVKKEIECW